MKIFMYCLVLLIINIVAGYALFDMAWQYQFGDGYGLHPMAALCVELFMVIVSTSGISSMRE